MADPKGSEDHSESEEFSGSGEEKPQKLWDPNKKPKKGILIKEGAAHTKKEGHIAVKADDADAHDAEKKPKKDLPVEGVAGIVKKGAKPIKRRDPDDKSHMMITRNPNIKSNESSEEKKSSDKTDKPKKEKEGDKEAKNDKEGDKESKKDKSKDKEKAKEKKK